MSCFVLLEGYLGQDTQVFTPSKTKREILSFSVGDSSTIGGEKITSWYDCKYYVKEKDALFVIEAIKKLRKGDKVHVEGYQNDGKTWVDRGGQSKTPKVVTITKVHKIATEKPVAQKFTEGFDETSNVPDF